MIEPAMFSDDSQESLPKSSKADDDDPIKSVLSKIDNLDDDSNFASVDLDSFATVEPDPRKPDSNEEKDSDTDSDSDDSDKSDSEDEKDKIAYSFDRAKHPEEAENTEPSGSIQTEVGDPDSGNF